MTDPALFTLTVLAILATPGPTNTLLATAAAASGLRQALPLVPAEAAGYLIAILTIGFAVGPVVAQSPAVRVLLQVAVGAYLLMLAAKLWRQGGPQLGTGPLVTPVQVFTTTLLNPKALVFALGVVPFGSPGVWRYLAGFVALLTAVSSAWIGAGAAVGRVAGPTRIVPRVGAAAVATFAVVLLTAPLWR